MTPPLSLVLILFYILANLCSARFRTLLSPLLINLLSIYKCFKSALGAIRVYHRDLKLGN